MAPTVPWYLKKCKRSLRWQCDRCGNYSDIDVQGAVSKLQAKSFCGKFDGVYFHKQFDAVAVMVKRFLLNGKLAESAAPLSPGDRAFNYGDGVFETLRYVGGRAPLLAFHLSRLEHACNTLRLPIVTADIESRVNLFCRLLRETEYCRGVLKILVSRSEGARGCYLPTKSQAQVFLSYQSPTPEHVREKRVELIEAPQPLPSSSALAGIKHLSRLGYIAAELSLPAPIEAMQEMLLLDADCRVIETMHHNIFFRLGRCLHTPQLNRCGVSGIMRRWVIDEVAQADLTLEQGQYYTGFFDNADEVFITNAVQGVVSVSKFQHRDFNDCSVAADLQAALQRKFNFYES